MLPAEKEKPLNRGAECGIKNSLAIFFLVLAGQSHLLGTAHANTGNGGCEKCNVYFNENASSLEDSESTSELSISKTANNASGPQLVAASRSSYTPEKDISQNLQRENFRSGWNDIRVAARGGIDRLWRENEAYQAAGLDVSYVRRHIGTRLVRFEGGGAGSFLLGDTQDLVGFNYQREFRKIGFGKDW